MLTANFFAKKEKKNSAGVKLIPEFVRNVLFQRWAIIICLSLLLALLLTPHIHLIHPTYKLGSIAAKDVRSDRDFLVEDKASTEQKKIEATENVKQIYDYDSGIPSLLKTNIVRAFTAMAETYRGLDEKKAGGSIEDRSAALKKARKAFEKTSGAALTDSEFSALNKRGFSFDIRDNIVKLIYSVYDENLIIQSTFSKREKDKGIIIRDVKTQGEEEKKGLSSILNVEQAEALLVKQSKTVLKNGKTKSGKIAVSLAKRLIEANLTLNKNETEKRKQTGLDNVKPVYTRVQKNEMIVREGERITHADMDKLEAFFKVQKGRNFLNLSILTGIFLTIMTLLAISYYLSKKWLKNTEKTSKDILFLGTALVFQILLVKAGIFISESIPRALTFISMDACFYAAPFAMGAMLAAVLLNRDIAFMFAVISSCLVTFLFNEKIFVLLFSLLGSIVGIYRIGHYRQRTAFFKSGLFVGIINIIVIICLSMLTGSVFSMDMPVKLVMGFIGGLLSGIIVAGIAPVFESLFDYTTDIKLLELANLNQPIFRRMIMAAPGTYHHSIVVASMVEAAAEAINANSLLAGVGAYYHDIGKLKKPLYFIENQQKGENKHDKLSPKMSSLVIISHVKEGIELANKYKLGKTITDIISQHHGTSIAGYFYEKAKKDRDISIRSIPESDFRYPGPRPQTKEAGLVLLGDVIEASSRILTNPTPSRIKTLVRDRIAQVLADGQLDECDLTLSDINKISESFIRILNGIFHQRIDYPEPAIKENNGKKETHGSVNRQQTEGNNNRFSTGAQGIARYNGKSWLFGQRDKPSAGR